MLLAGPVEPRPASMPSSAVAALEERGGAECTAPFSVGTKALAALNEIGKSEENTAALAALGGSEGLCKALCTSSERGVESTGPSLETRRAVFGPNVMPKAELESWISLFLGCFDDFVLRILLAAAVVSIIIGSIPQLAEGTPEEQEDHAKKGWLDGFAVLIAVVLVAGVTATNDYSKGLQFRALSEESESRAEVTVIRDGLRESVNPADVCVGDVVHLETGSRVPADGVVLRASECKANESAITGESDTVTKAESATGAKRLMISGTQIVNGNCDFVVTATGARSISGAIMADAVAESEDTPLQVKLNILVMKIGYVGFATAIGTFIAMMCVKPDDSVAAWGPWTVKAVIYAVTIIVVAIPEGLPLAVVISLAYSTRKMLKDNNLIRQLEACETMGSATDICSDKTGTLTENRMTVTALWLGGVLIDELPSTSDEVAASTAVTTPATSRTWGVLPPSLRGLLRDQLAANSTANLMASTAQAAAFAASSRSVGSKAPKAPLTASAAAAAARKREVKGSKTEGAGLLLVEAMGFDIEETRGKLRVLRQYPFSSDRKMMTTLLQRADGSILQLTTGGSDFVIARCSAVLSAAAAAPAAPTLDLEPIAGALPAGEPLTTPAKNAIMADVVERFARLSLRTIALAVREWPSISKLPSDWETVAPESEGLTLYAVQGIKDPLRGDVKQAVADCQRAGITVRMVTGDNRTTAEAIARECGILTPGGLVLEGPVFRELTPAQLDEILPILQVLSRSSPKDKNILVRRLNGNLPSTKEEWLAEHIGADWDTQRATLLPGHKEEWLAARMMPNSRGRFYKAVVGVTGDGTNDAPALKASDVGLAMGIAGTDVAKDAADIIILDDRFASIAKSVLWGRSVFDNVQKFLQFQLVVNVVALVLTFIAACLRYTPPLNPIMMLWVNLIMDTLGALALATEEPLPSLLERPPYDPGASLLSLRMVRFILANSVVQLVVVFYFLINGAELLGVNALFLVGAGKWQGKLTDLASPAKVEKNVNLYMSTFIFNYFVLSQLFNEFNARELGDSITGAFRGLSRNYMFLSIIFISLGLQAFFVEIGGPFFKTTGLIGLHWGYCFGLAALTLPVGALQRLIPVPTRASDYASYTADWFKEKMAAARDKRRAAAV